MALVRAFAKVSTAETTALLAILGQLVTEPMLVARLIAASSHR